MMTRVTMMTMMMMTYGMLVTVFVMKRSADVMELLLLTAEITVMRLIRFVVRGAALVMVELALGMSETVLVVLYLILKVFVVLRIVVMIM